MQNGGGGGGAAAAEAGNNDSNKNIDENTINDAFANELKMLRNNEQRKFCFYDAPRRIRHD
jgi:hypothetical protein